VTLLAGHLTDPAGNQNAAYTLDFFALAGDVNRDRSVNFDDLLVIAQNYGQTGRTFSQGNVNYDAGGEVGFDDLLLLAQRYETTLNQVTTTSTPTRRNGGRAIDVVT
jgi:hypothetical protein